MVFFFYFLEFLMFISEIIFIVGSLVPYNFTKIINLTKKKILIKAYNLTKMDNHSKFNNLFKIYNLTVIDIKKHALSIFACYNLLRFMGIKFKCIEIIFLSLRILLVFVILLNSMILLGCDGKGVFFGKKPKISQNCG